MIQDLPKGRSCLFLLLFFGELCYNGPKEGETMKQKPLSQEGLKLIACLTMLTDHVGAVFFPQNLWFRIIGRLAFPIYCFLLAEGAHYTGNPVKYGLRLFAGLILSEVPFDLALHGGLSWAHQSVMFTLLLAFFMALVMKKLPLAGKLLAVIPFYFAAELLHTDYGGLGIIMAAVFLIGRDLPEPTVIQTSGLLLVNLCYFQTSFFQPIAAAAMIPIILYSGRKSTKSRLLQWAFYLFYPVHLLVLWLLFAAMSF